MLSIDLQDLSPQQLQELIGSARKRLDETAADHARETRDQLVKLARERGYEIADLFGIKAASKAGRGKAAAKAEKSDGVAKFRHPKNGTLTWVGRGKRPKWVKEWLASGGTMDDLAA